MPRSFKTHLFRRANFPSEPILRIIILAELTVELIEMLSVDAFLRLNKLRPLPLAFPSSGSMSDGAKLELEGRRLPRPWDGGVAFGGVTGMTEEAVDVSEALEL
jgi:hypothetical protein